ncbi:MAG: PQQ-dependent sugar dehydrogenase [Bacteroidota bacterium]
MASAIQVPELTDMQKRLTFLLITFIAVLVITYSCSQLRESSKQPALAIAPDNGSISLPDGFSAVVVADSLGRGRHIAVNGNGDIYIKLRGVEEGKGGIAALRDNNGDGQADQIDYFDDLGGTGIAIQNDFLYYASDSAVFRKPLDGNLVPQAPRDTIVIGLPSQRNHAAKPITFDGAGNLYVNVGAPSNACQEEDRQLGSPAMDPCPYLELQGSVWRFSDSKFNQTQQVEGYKYSTGIRNMVALEWNAGAGALYGVQHGRDMLNTLYPNQYDNEGNAELPSEEFYRFEDGGDYGWPFCYYDHIKGKKVLAPEYGGDGEVQDRCADVGQPIMGFPAHIAPNDLLFYSGNLFPERYKGGAFIAFHGSWNRAPLPQKGYFVVFVPFENGMPSGDWEIFADNFAGEPGAELRSPRAAEFRPTGLAEGPDGSLYVVDSNRGRVWRIVYSPPA